VTARRRATSRIANRDVAAVFDAYPLRVRTKLLALRRLVLDVAAETAGVGELEETLKWRQPSYLTTTSGSGSLIRIDQVKSADGAYAVYFHCQTNLVPRFRKRFGDVLTFEGNRAIVFEDGDEIPRDELRHCIALALTYHRDKRRAATRRRSAR
jgi:hypothetical protein